MHTVGPRRYRDGLTRHTFCLALPGDGWSSRVVDGIVHGCIPVILQDESYMFYEGAFKDVGLPVDYADFSVMRLGLLRTICTHAHMHMHMHVHTCICTCACTHVHMHMYMHTCCRMPIRMCIRRVCTCMHRCALVKPHLHTHMLCTCAHAYMRHVQHAMYYAQTYARATVHACMHVYA